jgi:hypothetical protein
MCLPDDNHPSSFRDHYGVGCHAGLEGLASYWQDLPICSFLFLSNFSAKNLLINSHQDQAHQIAAHPFHHLPMGRGLGQKKWHKTSFFFETQHTTNNNTEPALLLDCQYKAPLLLKPPKLTRQTLHAHTCLTLRPFIILFLTP